MKDIPAAEWPFNQELTACSFTVNRAGEVIQWIEGHLPFFLESCYVDHQSLPCIFELLARQVAEDIRAYLGESHSGSRALALRHIGLKIRSQIHVFSLSLRPFFTEKGEFFILTLHPGPSHGNGEQAEELISRGYSDPADPEILRAGRQGMQAYPEMRSSSGDGDADRVFAELNDLYARVISELNTANSFLRSAHEYSGVTVLLLDRSCKLRKFLPYIGNYAGTTPYDIGSPLKKVLHTFDDKVRAEMARLGRKVLDIGKSTRREAFDLLGNRFYLQLSPYRSREGEVAGLILTLKSLDPISDQPSLNTPHNQGCELFFDSAPDMCVIFDARGNILNCNLQFVRKLGYRSKKEIIGRSISDFSAPNYTYKFEEKLKHLRNGIPVEGLHKLIIGRANILIPVEVHANPIRDGKGRTLSYMAVWRDMRDIHRAENLVHTLLTSYPNTQDDFWDWDMLDGTFTSCHTTQEWFGFTPEEMPDSLRSWYRLADPVDLKSFKKCLRAHIHSRGRRPFSLEMKFRRKDNTMAHICIRGRVVKWTKDGKPARMMGTQIDVSHLKKVPELEKQLQEKNLAFDEIIESTSAGYWDWDIKKGVEYMSSTFKRMFGYSDAEMPNRPESWQKIVHPEDLKLLWKNFEQHAQSRGEVPFEKEVRFFHKEGHIVWVWCRGKVIEWDEEGNPVRMIGSHLDISRLKNLDQTNKELERFAYIASHDLQEPLRTIIDFGSLLKDEYSDRLGEEGKMYLDFIKNSAVQMSTLVRDILTYSQSIGNTTRERVDLNDIFKRTVMNLFTVISEKDARLESDYLPVVFGHETELFSLFMNLIGNALKFNKPGEAPRIHIRSESSETHWSIVFRDEGIGIAPENQERIFEIFQRLHNREDYEGNGIGLAHCVRIARNHGGGIEVKSEENKGSTFIVSISKS